MNGFTRVGPYDDHAGRAIRYECQQCDYRFIVPASTDLSPESQAYLAEHTAGHTTPKVDTKVDEVVGVLRTTVEILDEHIATLTRRRTLLARKLEELQKP